MCYIREFSEYYHARVSRLQKHNIADETIKICRSKKSSTNSCIGDSLASPKWIN